MPVQPCNLLNFTTAEWTCAPSAMGWTAHNGVTKTILTQATMTTRESKDISNLFVANPAAIPKSIAFKSWWILQIYLAFNEVWHTPTPPHS
mmetsp:Transcript_58178/g.101882  ORF Transcript_58178/g.101882 Transcript_58178/m.101882 type:complete len:91 (+) Transcript_58178:116-388(+)